MPSCQIFRCWLIYNKSWRITVLPLILLLYNVSCLPMLTYWSCGDPTPNAHCSHIRLGFFTGSIILNIYATGTYVKGLCCFYGADFKLKLKLLSFGKYREIVYLCAAFVTQSVSSLNRDYYTPSRVWLLCSRCLAIMRGHSKWRPLLYVGNELTAGC